MDDLQRAVGRLEGKLDGVKDELKNLATSTQKSHDELKKEVKLLNQFKWRVAGGAGLLAVILTGIVEFFHIKGD